MSETEVMRLPWIEDKIVFISVNPTFREMSFVGGVLGSTPTEPLKIKENRKRRVVCLNRIFVSF
jgi:hypothetical protein